MPYSSKAIANAFLNKAAEEGASIEPLKLQKLIYYASGYYLAAYHEALIDCSIEAWDYGPVVPEVYREFRDFGSKPITRRATEFDWTTEEEEEVAIPTDARVRKVIDFVWKTYGKYSGLQLSDMTHADNSPWDKVRKERPGIRNADIPEDTLKEHFAKFIKKRAQ